MKFFKDSSNQVFAYAADGSQDAFIQSGLVQISESEADALRKTVLTEIDFLLDKIYELEASVTDRRIREAVLGIDNGWLKALNEQIAELRATLK